MKQKMLYVSALLLSSGLLFAQGEMDAYRYSQTDLNGTARSMSMGGAFGALGGDMSVMSHNPAGLSVYRSSEVQTTLGLTMESVDANWTGVKNSQDRTRFNLDNISYVGYFPTGEDSGIKGWNFGFSYNRAKSFYRTYSAVGNPKYSMADYTASMTTNAYTDGGIPENDLISSNTYDPFNNSDLSGNWLSILGYEGGYFGTQYQWNDVYHSGFGSYNGSTWVANSPQSASMKIKESGWLNEYNFAASMNISDRVFVGATLAITDLNYRMYSDYGEDFGGKDNLRLENGLETEGTGYSVNVGVIVRPIDELRLGVAYNTPKWYYMTDYYSASANSNISAYSTPYMSSVTPNGAFDYAFRSPDRWIFSAAGIIGTTALVSVDYELTNYKTMRLGDRDASEYYDDVTEQVKNDFKLGQTLKIGAEVKVTPQFAVRAGYVWQPTPMNDPVKDGDLEVYTAGTIPHYATMGTTNHYTVGLGYRFTPNFYMDLACIYRVQKQNLFPFSSVYIEDAAYHIENVLSEPAKIDANQTRLALTFGYKF